MKKLVIMAILVAGIFQVGILAQSFATDNSQGELQDPKAKAAVEWQNTEVDFGKIVKNNPSTAYFRFKNTGSLPVLVTKAKGSCGCTGIKHPTEPVKPGETGTIQATYNAASMGAFSKTVEVELNIENSRKILRLKGEVVESLE